MTVSGQLLEAIGAQLGRSLAFEAGTSGGCISASFTALAGEDKVFIKTGDATRLAMFEAEADGLAALSRAGTHRVPAVLATGVAEGSAYLVLEWLDLKPMETREDAEAAGHALAELHRNTGERYGWTRDNFIGSTPQANPESDSWPFFFARQRLRPQLALARQNDYPRELRVDGERLAEAVPALLFEYRPTPCLLHGDLWHGNAAMADGRPALFDPAVYYGDREADLAMTELFGGFPGAFYLAYREAFPLDHRFQQRKNLYNLYHILNHLNLFGRSYLGQAERMLKKLLKEARS